jgi:hypothetical protein
MRWEWILPTQQTQSKMSRMRWEWILPTQQTQTLVLCADGVAELRVFVSGNDERIQGCHAVSAGSHCFL